MYFYLETIFSFERKEAKKSRIRRFRRLVWSTNNERLFDFFQFLIDSFHGKKSSKFCLILITFFNRPFMASFSLFSSFQYSWRQKILFKNSTMTGVGSNCSANLDTITALRRQLLFIQNLICRKVEASRSLFRCCLLCVSHSKCVLLLCSYLDTNLLIIFTWGVYVVFR